MSLELVTKASKRPLPVIAIDGPAGAGKSTAARVLAYQLRFTLVDTGAIYRSLSLAALEKNISLNDGPALGLLCEGLKVSFGPLEMAQDGIPKQRVFLSGVDVSESIRTPEIGMAASNVSKQPEVRRALLQLQRDLGAGGGIVMEGRDIGTVIFPDAELKFFLMASVESRARRRFDELRQSGLDIEFDQVLRETKARDEQDMNRSVAPLKQAEDAILIDSTNQSLEKVVEEMSSRVRQHLRS